MTEIWKDVSGYEGLYQVSNLGRVKSVPRCDKVTYTSGTVWYRNRKGRIIHQNNHLNGYKLVNLCKDGTSKTYFVHRLVANAFLPNPSSLPQVNHKDGDKDNNSIENLEWCTCKENVKHAFLIGLRKGGVLQTI
jgi:hypothetical protein